MDVTRVIESLGAQPLTDVRLTGGCWLVRGGSYADLVVSSGCSANALIVDDGGADRLSVDVDVERGGVVNIIQLVTEGYDHDMEIVVAEGGVVNFTQLVLAPAKVKTVCHLQGANARFEMRGSFVACDQERCDVGVNVLHEVGDCVSRTTYKGVASGKAQGSFSSLVYIAQDAQHTDAKQLSRNVTIGDAVINTSPQMEIYADDVRCSHGATVGQMDAEAIMYMRQRGLSMADAKRLQIEGFIADTVMHSAIEGSGESLMELLFEKLNRL